VSGAPAPASAAAAERPCPFCGAAAFQGCCPACGRDPTARRRACGRCAKMTPFAEPACCHCGAPQSSGLAGRIVLIVLLFAVALGASVALALAR
jgi:hypothetical protein